MTPSSLAVSVRQYHREIAWSLNAVGLFLTVVAALILYLYPPRFTPAYTETGEQKLTLVNPVTAEGRAYAKQWAQYAWLGPLMLILGFSAQLAAAIFDAPFWTRLSPMRAKNSQLGPVSLVVITLGVYVVMVTVVGTQSGKWSETIYFLTGAVLVWYTVETYAIRRQATRQGDLAVMPFVLARLEPAPYALVLRNIGNGPALYVKVQDIEFDLGLNQGKPDPVARFATTDVIEAKTEVVATVELSRNTDQGLRPMFEYLSAFDPEYQKQLNLPVVIEYQDLDGQSHRTRLEMGKNGTRFIAFESGSSA